MCLPPTRILVVHGGPPDLDPGVRVCRCAECEAWPAPPRRYTSGPRKYGRSVAWRGRWWSLGADGYYQNKRAPGRMLHRAIWLAHVGPIPMGWHVHHRNEDRADNRLENLEALSPADHAAIHDRRLPALTPEERGARTRTMWAERTERLVACPCGAEFTSVGMRARYCSGRCERIAQGRDPDKGTKRFDCEHCGVGFMASRRARFCSHRCRQAHRRAAAAGV